MGHLVTTAKHLLIKQSTGNPLLVLHCEENVKNYSHPSIKGIFYSTFQDMVF